MPTDNEGVTLATERNGHWASIYAYQINMGYSACLMGFALESNPEVDPEKSEAWKRGWTQAQDSESRRNAKGTEDSDGACSRNT